MSSAKKVGLILMVIGGCLAYYGVLEYQVGSQAAPESVDVELADLEAGKPLPDNHIRIGLHHCMYNISVVEYEFDSDSEQIRPSSPVNWTWSPLISDKHAYAIRIRELIKTYGSVKKIPRSENWPVLKDFVVLLKSETYKTYKDISDGRKYYKSVSGLVINRIESLGDDEKKLIRRKFPKIDFDKILIVEHGRKPSSAALSISIITGGGLLFLLPLFIFSRRMGAGPQVNESPEPTESEQQTQAAPPIPEQDGEAKNPYR